MSTHGMKAYIKTFRIKTKAKIWKQIRGQKESNEITYVIRRYTTVIYTTFYQT